MSRSRSLSYCSLSYSWRLIRFTRRRRRSGTAWGLEKAHTHTRACTCTHAQIRHARADNEKGIQMHTCTHRHNWTQRKTDLSFYLNINITECLHTWMSGSSIRGENYVKTNKQLSWTPALHYWRCFGPSDFQWKWSHAEMLPTYVTKAGQTKTLELNKYFSSKQHSGVQLSCFYLIFNSSSVFFRSCENRSMSSDI